jgi:hypothetical protein
VRLLSPPDLEGGPAVGGAARPGGEGAAGRVEEASGWGQGRAGEHGGGAVVTGSGGCCNPPRKIPYYRLNQSTLVIKR